MKRILLVEDEPIVRVPLATLLEKNGYAVGVAETQVEALRAASPSSLTSSFSMSNWRTAIRASASLNSSAPPRASSECQS